MAKTNSHAQANGDLPEGLSAPAQRALAGAGISRLAQLAKMTEAEVKALHGIGPNALAKLRAALEAKGLKFKGEK
jgi:predicted flap endonuclease-1-like 5' DNA nuclease